ncbi:MAG: fumarylacetoacetate hydrolase family protein [Saprospiraceae bacterium]|jgi:2-oxo-3-hexenedioate decarboxylase|nr:fumarylacetoacetate hydrolase family protein [Saprospiraceae bacterium]
MNIQHLAQILDDAARNAKSTEQLSLIQSFTEQQAYEIQAASITRRYNRGEKFIGIKMGFTSKAKMEQMGVHDMIWGVLTDRMLIKNGGELLLDKYIHPRAEPEICFLVGKRIDRALTLEEAKDHVVGVTSAIEIIDSRYENFKFSLEDVIADNCSSAGLVIGTWQKPPDNLDRLKITLAFDGEVVQSGSSAAILDNPWESVVAATRLASQYGLKLPIGSYIMAGAATPAMYLKKGMKVTSEVEELGNTSFSVV